MMPPLPHRESPAAGRAILLDKDGVLVDFHRTWKPAIKRAAQAVAHLACRATQEAEKTAQRLLVSVGYEPHADDFLPGSIWAAGTQDELFDAWARQLPALPRARIAETVSTVLGAAEPHPVVPLEELRALLQQARSQGWKIAVLTNDRTDGAIATAQAYGIFHLLDAIIGADLCARPKPHPDLALQAAQRLRLPPSAMVMVGDNIHDGEMARRAGCAGFIGVLSGTSGHADLAPLADAVVEDVAAALRMLLEEECTFSGSVDEMPAR